MFESSFRIESPLSRAFLPLNAQHMCHRRKQSTLVWKLFLFGQRIVQAERGIEQTRGVLLCS